VTNITRRTAKVMLPPSYHPSSMPCDEYRRGKEAESKSRIIKEGKETGGGGVWSQSTW
ncbi:hypothetical protein PanWU01x14_204320, partial [Parasponia andersonii]